MKKIATLAAIAAISFGASAQLKVVNNGQSQLGTPEDMSMFDPILPGTLSTNSTPGITTDISTQYAKNDSLAPLCVMGLGKDGSWPRISFGYANAASIGEGAHTTDKRRGNGVLTLKGSNGFSFIHGAENIFYYTPKSGNTSTQVFYFRRNVTAPSFITASDARLKTDIEELDNAGEQLKKLVPVSYLFASEATDNDTEAVSAYGNTAGTRHHYGFLAQDVREIFPDLVYEDADGMLSLDYQGFIPILVDAVKSLQATAESLQTKVDEQAEIIRTLTGQQNGQKSDGPVVAALSQNRPNPFSASTVITCTLPDNVATAFLCIYDLNGNQKMRRDINSRGNVDVTIDGNSLNAGMYIYTLIADGIEVDSKRMILTD